MNSLRENLIFIFFGACFAVCALLWFQLSRIPDQGEFQQPTTTPDRSESVRVERVLALADRMIFTTAVEREGNRHLSSSRLDRNLFELPGLTAVQVQAERPELPAMRVSGISWSAQLPLAVINENILAEGEWVPGSEVRVRRIEPEQVLVSYRGYTYHVDPPMDVKGGN